MKVKKTVDDYKLEFEGKKFVNKRGFEYEVLKINSAADCEVYFPHNNFKSIVRIKSLINRAVRECEILPLEVGLNEKYGELTVTGFKGNLVNLSCSCGNVCTNTKSNLIYGRKTSCGCKPTTHLYDKFWNRFNELVGKWNPDTHKGSVKKLPIFGFRKGSPDLEKIIAFTYVDTDFYEAWKDYPFTKDKMGMLVWLQIHILTGTAVRGRRDKRVKYKLHHMVRGHTNFGNYVVDHINSLPLDNRFSNLRTATHLENSRNSQKPRGKRSSVYKGVSYLTTKYINKQGVVRGAWKVCVAVGSKQYTKYCNTEQEAALAYNELAKEHYGEFAKLNNVKLEND